MLSFLDSQNTLTILNKEAVCEAKMRTHFNIETRKPEESYPT